MTPWLELCRAAVGDLREVFAAMPTRIEREPVVGDGAGGDETTAVDAAAEDAIVARLETLHAEEGVDFHLVSEELGERTFGTDPKLRVVVDPIDGSLNAKRNIPYFSVSIAVAEGATMKDVVFGFVHDFGTGEEWTAERGKGARLNGEPLGAIRPKEKVEVLALEATVAVSVAEKALAFAPFAKRLRIMGSLALSLCSLAAGRVDAVCSLKEARAVDIAAAQLLLRELGLPIIFIDAGPFDESPLDTAARRSPPGRRRSASSSRTSLPPGRIGCSAGTTRTGASRLSKGCRLALARALRDAVRHVEVNSTFYRLTEARLGRALGRADARRFPVHGQGEPLPHAHQTSDATSAPARTVSTSGSSRSCARRRWARSSGSSRGPSGATTIAFARALAQLPAGPALLRVPPRELVRARGLRAAALPRRGARHRRPSGAPVPVTRADGRLDVRPLPLRPSRPERQLLGDASSRSGRQRIEDWRSRIDVYAYFNNDWLGYAVRNGIWLRKRLEA